MVPQGVPGSAERVVARFLRGVEARDAAAAARCFSARARYRNMPHQPVHGPAGVQNLLEPILARASRVRWEVVTAAYAEKRAWLERVDRFWIEGTEYAIECNAVIDVDPGSGLIAEFRDYVDLQVWRRRLGDVLAKPLTDESL